MREKIVKPKKDPMIICYYPSYAYWRQGNLKKAFLNSMVLV